MVFVFSTGACDGNKNWKAGYEPGEVSSNGGFAVEVGNYTYFINGVEANTANNSFGKPVKGALVRVKTAELGQGVNAESAEVVVPKLFASSFYGTDVAYKTGLTIFGDYVYYGTPSTEKDKKGNVQNDIIVFQKTKLDGTDTTKIAEFDGVSTEYKFVQSGETVYLVVIKNVGSDSSKAYDINVYTENGSKVFTREAVDSLILPYEFEGDYIFYTDLEKDEDEQDKAYGSIYSYKLGDDAEKIIVSGVNDFNGGLSGSGVQGRVFTVDKYINDLLYFSYLSADTNDGTRNQYAYVKIDSTINFIAPLTAESTETEKADFNTKNQANFDKLVALGSSQSIVNAIIPTAIYGENTVVYYDSNYGIIAYDYTQADVAPYYGTQVILDKSKITISGAKLLDIVNNYAYFTESNSLVYRIDLTDETATMQQVTTVATQTAWYYPEVVGDYLLVNLSGEPYNTYIYAFNLDMYEDIKVAFATELEDLQGDEYQEKLEELKEDYLQDIADKTEDAIQSILDKRIGDMKKADKEAVSSYMTSAYTSSSSSN